MSRLLALLCIGLLAGCGDTKASGVESTEGSGIEQQTAPAPATGVDGPVMRYPVAVENADGNDAEVGGTLILEGACLYLGFDCGERFPVVWPAQTSWDAGLEQLILPSGETVAPGEELAGGGGYGDVEGVGTVAGEQAQDLAEQCVDNTYGEIAFVNNHVSAIQSAG